MRPAAVFALSILCLVATAPWFFGASGDTQVFGFPPWAFYSFCMTGVYAVLLAVLIGRYWSMLAGGDEEGDGPDG